MTHLGSLEQRRLYCEPDMLVSPAKTAAAVAAAATSHSDAVWAVGQGRGFLRKRQDGTPAIRSLPRSDLVEISYTIDGDNSAKVPRLKLGESWDCTQQILPVNDYVDVLVRASHWIVVERCSPRLVAEQTGGVTAKPDQVTGTVTVTVNGGGSGSTSAEGRTFPVIESIEPNSLVATQCPNVEPGMVCCTLTVCCLWLPW